MSSSSSSSKVASVRRWRPRQYVLAGMAAIVAASTVVIVTSVILRPAHINFYATDARVIIYKFEDNINPEGDFTLPGRRRIDPEALFFNFTLAVDNPSRRAVVRYNDIVVNLQIEKRRVVQATVGIPMPFEQPPKNKTHMTVGGFLEPKLSDIYAVGKSAADLEMALVVMALVRFRVGLAYTRLYDIRITCSPVNFFNQTYYAAKVNCSA